MINSEEVDSPYVQTPDLHHVEPDPPLCTTTNYVGEQPQNKECCDTVCKKIAWISLAVA